MTDRSKETVLKKHNLTDDSIINLVKDSDSQNPDDDDVKDFFKVQ